MATWYLEMEETLERLQQRLLDAPGDVRERWTQDWSRYRLASELGIEGVTLADDDIERALGGSSGRDYVDGRHLAHIRAIHGVVVSVSAAAASLAGPPSPELWEDFAGRLAGEGGAARRTSDGATEQYKHDTVPPGEIPTATAAFFELLAEAFYTRPPLQLAVEAHHRYARLWPWETGSGILARAIAAVVLEAQGFPAPVIPASMRQAYYQSLHYDIRRLTEVSAEAWKQQASLLDRFLLRGDAPPDR